MQATSQPFTGHLAHRHLTVYGYYPQVARSIQFKRFTALIPLLMTLAMSLLSLCQESELTRFGRGGQVNTSARPRV